MWALGPSTCPQHPQSGHVPCMWTQGQVPLSLPFPPRPPTAPHPIMKSMVDCPHNATFLWLLKASATLATCSRLKSSRMAATLQQ